MSFGRLILLLISLKDTRITKCYFYYEVLYFLVEQFLPVEHSQHDGVFYVTMQSLFNFMLFYFNFWPSMLCIVLQVPFYFYTRSLFFDEPFE